MRQVFHIVPLVLGALALGASSAPAQTSTAAQRYRNMDTNADGVVSREEWRGDNQAFEARDTNDDGVLSREELRPGPHWNRQERGTTGEFREWTPARFRDLDRNGDNRLSLDEWPEDDATFRRIDANRNGWLSLDEFLGFDTAPATGRRFDELDRNRDGHVTIEEWGTDVQGFQAMDHDRSGLLTRYEVDGTDDAPADLFGSLDANRDGRVTRNEWRWSAEAFDRRDTDRNGVLSQGELSSRSSGSTVARSAAYRAGSERGLADGRKAGREDKQLRNRWDLEGQRELEQADAGYAPTAGDRSEYQAGYREAFRRGYAEGFGPR
jgi:Ca2+-binding EF-hand superfamily protein